MTACDVECEEGMGGVDCKQPCIPKPVSAQVPVVSARTLIIQRIRLALLAVILVCLFFGTCMSGLTAVYRLVYVASGSQCLGQGLESCTLMHMCEWSSCKGVDRCLPRPTQDTASNLDHLAYDVMLYQSLFALAGFVLIDIVMIVILASKCV